MGFGGEGESPELRQRDVGRTAEVFFLFMDRSHGYAHFLHGKIQGY